MIYKIIGNFIDNSYIEVIEIVKKYNKILCKNNCIYIALNNYEDKEKNEELLEETFNKRGENRLSLKELYLIKISEDNLKNEPFEIIEWSKENFIRLDGEKFAFDNKDKINSMFGVLDIFERNLQQIYMNKLNLEKQKENYKEIHERFHEEQNDKKE